jgi:threonine aldolase
MGNLASVLAQAARGDSIIADENAHLYVNEAGNLAVVGGITVRTVQGSRGVPSSAGVEAAIFPRKAVLHPPSTVLCLENTHNLAGGTCISASETQRLADIAHKHGMSVHIDGARLFNAAVALNTTAAELAAPADSVTFCLSKGLGCPAGAIVAGSSRLVESARHWRQMLGGGMRQAGVIAACGLVALDKGVERLVDDHAHARMLAEKLAERDLPVYPSEVESNMVYLPLPAVHFDATRFKDELEKSGIIINPVRGGRVRFVTHSGIRRKDVCAAADHIVAAFRAAYAPRSSTYTSEGKYESAAT